MSKNYTYQWTCPLNSAPPPITPLTVTFFIVSLVYTYALGNFLKKGLSALKRTLINLISFRPEKSRNYNRDNGLSNIERKKLRPSLGFQVVYLQCVSWKRFPKLYLPSIGEIDIENLNSVHWKNCFHESSCIILIF